MKGGDCSPSVAGHEGAGAASGGSGVEYGAPQRADRGAFRLELDGVHPRVTLAPKAQGVLAPPVGAVGVCGRSAER